MNLYILRHAKAEEPDARFDNDSERPLTTAGEKEMFDVAKGMAALELKFDLILSSPFIRAKRTADIVAEVFKLGKVRLSDHLQSHGSPNLLIEELRKDYSSSENVLLVGHEPYLSNLISILCTGEKNLSLKLRKAGLCKLSLEKLRYGRCATLEWLLKPGQLRA